MNADVLMVAIILTNLMLLGTSRLAECIRMVAIQGVALGVLPFFVSGELTFHVFLLSAGIIVLKGIMFPFLLSRAVREAHVRREVEPFVGFTLSLVLGALALAAAFWLSSRLPFPLSPGSPLVLPGGFFMILVGLFLLVSRRIAVSQVLGYLVLENGIYIFGISLVHEQPLLVELGVLLDVFVAVFVMGIMIFHINREFDHIDTDRMDTLRDVDL
ncbi:MAG: NADH-quinone oxidoreductase subunit K [Elusimicrobiota bacterium]|jgi:hydrogenase-4 component E